MRMRQFFLVSVASVGLAVGAVSDSDAYALLKPVSSWALTKFEDGSSADQSGYCAVAKKFEENTILTMARNQSGDTSFALDLQKKLFNIDQVIPLKLDPGGGEQRNYYVSPASAQAFVVRLGRDDSFFNAVDRTGVLRVEVAKDTYVFNVEDIDVGQSKLNACLVPDVISKSVASIENVDYVDVASVNLQADDNDNFVDALKAQIDALKSENKVLQEKMLRFEKVKVQDFSVNHGELPPADLKALRAENFRLKAALQTDVVEQQSEHLRALESENKRLQNKLSKWSSAVKGAEILQERIELLLEEKAALKSQYSHEISMLHEQVEALELERSQNVSNHTEVEDLQFALSSLRKDNTLLQQKLLDKQLAEEKVSSNFSKLEISHEKLQSQFEKILHARQLQDKAIASLEQENSVLMSKLSEMNVAAKVVKRMEEQLSLLKKKLEESESVRQSQANDIAVLSNENNVLRQALSYRQDDGVSSMRSLKELSTLRQELESFKPGVILAAAKSAPVTPKAQSAKHKPVEEEVMFSERLAQLEPSSGDEEGALDAVVEEFTEVDSNPALADDAALKANEAVAEAEEFMDRELNQAQIYEEQLKRSLDNQSRIENSRSNVIDIENIEDNAINEAIENNIVSEEVVFKQKDVGLQEEPIEMRLSQDPFEGIEATEEDDIVHVKSGPEPNHVQPEELGNPMPRHVKQPNSQAITDVNKSSLNMGLVSIERVLKLTNIVRGDAIRAVDGKSNAYHWRAGFVYGSGEHRMMTSVDDFDGFVKEYLDRTEARCPGDFAIIPDNSKESGSMRVDSYDIACIGKDVSSSASLLFYNDGDVFIVLAHETEAPDMEEAMSLRDKIFDFLSN